MHYEVCILCIGLPVTKGEGTAEEQLILGVGESILFLYMGKLQISFSFSGGEQELPVMRCW